VPGFVVLGRENLFQLPARTCSAGPALTSVRKQIAFEKQAQQDALKSWEDAMAAYKGGVSGPLVPLITRQQLLLRRAGVHADRTRAQLLP
jgi:hypothetical protein